MLPYKDGKHIAKSSSLTHIGLDTPHRWLGKSWPRLGGCRCIWYLEYRLLPALPFNLGGQGGLDWPLDHCWGWLGSILGHQVGPQNYGGSTITQDHVSGGQYLLYLDLG